MVNPFFKFSKIDEYMVYQNSPVGVQQNAFDHTVNCYFLASFAIVLIR